MKNILVTLFIATSFIAFAQDLPTKPANGFAFPIGTKFTIKLHPTDSIHFDYSIIEFEKFQDNIDIWDNDKLFKETGEEGTIEFYFCLSRSTDEQKDKNMNVLLIMKNRTRYTLSYVSDIQTKKNGQFKETSNVGILSGAKATEMWPYMIYEIGLRDFKRKK